MHSLSFILFVLSAAADASVFYIVSLIRDICFTFIIHIIYIYVISAETLMEIIQVTQFERKKIAECANRHSLCEKSQ